MACAREVKHSVRCIETAAVRPVLTDPLKFWVIIRMRLPANVTGLRYQTSETAAPATAFVRPFVFSFDVARVVNMGAVALVVKVGVSGSASVLITAPGFKSGL